MIGIVQNKNKEKYRIDFENAKPFLYVVVDDFFNKDLLLKVSKDFPDIESNKWFRFRDKIGEFENIFESGMNAISKPENMPALCCSFLYNLNSLNFCKALEEITGIKGVQPDTH